MCGRRPAFLHCSDFDHQMSMFCLPTEGNRQLIDVSNACSFQQPLSMLGGIILNVSIYNSCDVVTVSAAVATRSRADCSSMEGQTSLSTALVFFIRGTCLRRPLGTKRPPRLFEKLESNCNVCIKRRSLFARYSGLINCGKEKNAK